MVLLFLGTATLCMGSMVWVAGRHLQVMRADLWRARQEQTRVVIQRIDALEKAIAH